MEEDEDDDPTRKFQLPPQTLISHLSRKELRREKEEGEGVESRKKKEEEEGSMDESRETKGKSKVPFHIPTIRRPQEEFSILVNNGNEPFEHVWLERSEDGTEFVHPLDKLSIQDFVERSIQEKEIVEPLPIEITPFKLVEGVKELKEMAAKLREVNEFAVDLEHNQYRSFQGLTCLMQISTRFEDFVIDTLKLRVHIGPYLREVFKDPSKRKVMHGADQDIQWLQRDFGIYVCNLFDTGQASRVLQLDRNSLEHLLNHFCGVIANKEYQNADWRLRPLTDEMLKYAREDTHYLLHIYDLMRNRLLLESPTEIYEVYQRSSEVCKNLYQKDIITATSFLHIYGILEMDFNSKQLAIADGLYRWRDKLAREEDESTGFILPNKLLLDIAKQMPVSSGRLRRLVKSKHAVVEHHLSDVVNIIRHSIETASDYETIVEQLEMARLGEKNANKVVHIQSSLTVPFHSLSGVCDSLSEPICSMATKQSQPENSQQHSVYTLESNETDSAHSWGSYPDTEAVVDPVSLSDLSSGFQQCFIQSVGQRKDKGPSSREPAIMFQERPFDKAAGEYNNGDK